MIIYGINPAVEALRAGVVIEVLVSDRRQRVLTPLLALAARHEIPVRLVAATELHRLTHGGRHQGVVVVASEPNDHSIPELIRGVAGPPLVVVLDGIEDPHNFGAIVRAAEAAGVDGIIRQTRHSAPRSPVAMKASAGALAHVRMAPVVNISRAIVELKRERVWTVGLDAAADRSYISVDLTQPTALVVGAEGTGLRRLVRERCDWLISIPMHGRVSSLNVSVATGIVLFEAMRQRLVARGKATQTR